MGDTSPVPLSRDEFDRRTRRYFHGTTAARAASLIADQRPDPAHYGSRTDYGFFGTGFYCTTEPSASYGKLILAIEVRLDASVLEWVDVMPRDGGYVPTSPPSWFDAMIARKRVAAAQRGRALGGIELAMITPGDAAFSIVEFVREAYAYAVAAGYDIFQPTGSETVIINPAVVMRIYRAASSFAAAVAKYSYDAYVASVPRRNPATIVIAPHEYPSTTAYGTSYGAFVRGIAHDLKSGDTTAIRYAAAAMAPLLPPGATLVPVPSSRGDTTANRRLAEAIARLAHARVEDGLGREPGESQYARRKRGATPLTAEEQRVAWTGGRLRDPVVLIDNVVTSGATAASAERAIGRTSAILVWADARRR